MKRCSTCAKELPLSEFGRVNKNRDGLDYSCKTCKRAYLAAHYRKNKPAYRNKARKWERKRADAIRAAKAKPCADCGGTYPPECMDFDHMPGEEKLFHVSHGHKMSAAKVDAEIAKCEVVCANCHRIRTASRRR